MTGSTDFDRGLAGRPSIRLYTHNIFGQSADWDRRRPVLTDGIKQLAPDLALFQETVVTASYDQVSEILAEGYQVEHSTTRESTGQGISIASRWPIVNTRELDL